MLWLGGDEPRQSPNRREFRQASPRHNDVFAGFFVFISYGALITMQRQQASFKTNDRQKSGNRKRLIKLSTCRIHYYTVSMKP